MCTALSVKLGNHYFGRNLDLPYQYKESVTIMPRNYPLKFRCHTGLKSHYAIIGTATVDNGYPLYYDATNEHGLSIAALNFPGNAVYQPVNSQRTNIASFELIPWILAQYTTADAAVAALKTVQIADLSYSKDYPLTPLHWILADQNNSFTLEPMSDGLHIYENNVGILTNNPPFSWHIDHLRQYMQLTSEEPTNKAITDGNGTGFIGLPGDLTSASRFIRAATLKKHAYWSNENNYNIAQFFHILQAVQQIEGCIRHSNLMDKTVYSSCCNATLGTYYYTTYENCQITAVNIYNENLEESSLISFPLRHQSHIQFEN